MESENWSEVWSLLSNARLRGLVTRFLLFFNRSFNTNGTHHSPVFVLQQVAMVDKRADDPRVAEIHAQPHARIYRAMPIPILHIDGVPQVWLVQRYPIPFLQDKVNLVDVKRVQFRRAVLDNPVFHVALPHGNIRSRRPRATLHRLP